MTAVIVDDELSCRDSLEYDLKKYCPQVAVLEKCESAKQGMLAIKKLKPDVIFIDVEMPWMNGFEMLEALQPVESKVVFVTAYDQYAVKAFRFTAMDYLLKPINHDDLVTAVAKVSESDGRVDAQRLEQLKINLNPAMPKRMALPTRGSIEFVPLTDIIYFEANGAYVTVFSVGRSKTLLSKSLGEVQEMLEGEPFFRIHNSHLVNVPHIKKFVRGDGGYVVMSNDTTITVARSRKDDLMRVLGI